MNSLALKKFLAAAGLSTRKFADLCGVGKTTVHRLAQAGHGGLTAAYVRGITPVLLRACRDHLINTNAPADSAHLILSDIFGDDFTPSLIHKTVLTPDMLRFFGLARDPFAPPRSAAEVFLTPEMEQVSLALEDAVRYQGFICILAPVGAGKTILKARLLADLCPKSKVRGPKSVVLNSPYYEGVVAAASADERGFSANAQRSIQNPKSKIPNPMVLSPQFADPSRVTAAGIVAYILEAFHIKPRRSLVLAQKQLEDRLAAIETPVALCFDECHRLSDTTLTALKNFYELGTGGFRRYLGLILFGQPQFRERLKMPRFREIAERLDIRDLPAFSAEEVEAYLTHCFERVDSNPGSPPYRERGHLARMDAQRSQSSPPNSTNSTNSMNFSFPPETIAAIAARASTPLAIANLAAAAMTAAYKKGERTVLARFVPAEPGPKTLKLAK